MPDPSNGMRPGRVRGCAACGGYHGPVGERIRCLESEVRRLRYILSPILTLRREVAETLRRWPSRIADRGL